MFIGRRPDGTVYGTWVVKQPDDADHTGIEEVEDSHPDVIAFVNRPIATQVDAVKVLQTKVAELEARLSATESSVLEVTSKVDVVEFPVK